MKEFKAEQLTKTYGEKQLFKNIAFSIQEGDKIGLIGINGTGKSSLMRILAQQGTNPYVEEEPFEGEFTYPHDYSVAYLPQETKLDPEKTVLEVVFKGEAPIMRAVRQYEEALLAMEEKGYDEACQAQFEKAENRMNETDAWLAETNAKIILQQLGISDLQQKCGTLSGGQQKRVGLAQVLIAQPDLLLLDEPTNHLDYRSICWLEKYLQQYKGALLVITHDRYFLDQVTNRIFELDHGIIYEYQGNYQSYLEGKALRLEQEKVQQHKQQRLYKQELAWMRKGVEARRTKQEARKKRFYDLKEAMKSNQKEEADWNIDLATTRLGKKVLAIEEGSLAFGDHVLFTHLNLLIQNHERLGITGDNGTGKTSLLNVLAGRLPLTSGVYEIGETVKIAYYTQQNEGMEDNKRVIQFLQEVAEETRTKDQSIVSVTEMLERFLFPRSMHGTLVGKLSGGEKRRLYLLKLLIQQPNVLLLDEPTNDLDIDTLTILEDYLSTFPGAVITVSHDRYFLDKVAERLLLFEKGEDLSLYYGSASEYFAEKEQSFRKTTKKEEKPKEPKVEEKPEKVEKKKLTYMEQKEWETIEEDIEQLETSISEIEDEMSQNTTADFVYLGELQQKLDEANQALEEKLERWEYLSQYV